jgi:lipase
VEPFGHEFEVPVEGGALRLSRAGCEPGGSAPVVLAAHGITSSSRAWTVVARLLGREVCFLATDLRGRGRSHAAGPPWGIARHAQDLEAILDRVGADRAIVAGHSMGAYVAGVLALRAPERVVSLVLVDGGLPTAPPPRADPDEALEAVLGPALARLRQTFASLDDYVGFWRRHPAFGDHEVREEDLRAYAERDLVGEPPELRPAPREEAVREDGRDIFLDDEIRTAATRASRPATLLRAPRGLMNDPDHPFLPAEEARAFSGRPEARVVEVENVNHYTITLGARGAAAVAGAIREAALGTSHKLPHPPGTPGRIENAHRRSKGDGSG